MGGRETVTRSAKPASVAIEDMITQTNTEYVHHGNRNLIRVADLFALAGREKMTQNQENKVCN
jgi:hypothetical protein